MDVEKEETKRKESLQSFNSMTCSTLGSPISPIGSVSTGTAPSFPPSLGPAGRNTSLFCTRTKRGSAVTRLAKGDNVGRVHLYIDVARIPMVAEHVDGEAADKGMRNFGGGEDGSVGSVGVHGCCLRVFNAVLRRGIDGQEEKKPCLKAQ